MGHGYVICFRCCIAALLRCGPASVWHVFADFVSFRAVNRAHGGAGDGAQHGHCDAYTPQQRQEALP